MKTNLTCRQRGSWSATPEAERHVSARVTVAVTFYLAFYEGGLNGDVVVSIDIYFIPESCEWSVNAILQHTRQVSQQLCQCLMAS